MNLNSVSTIQTAPGNNRSEVFRTGSALLFLLGIMLFMYYTEFHSTQGALLIVSAMIGGYMAMNIGANDVANNVGPAVGSNALTLAGAIIIAIIFESAGALIAGGSVVSTIKNGIIDPALIGDRDTFIWLMMAALFAAAIWLNIATFLNAPVSTTHSIVGGVLGAGIAAGGWEIANWSQVSAIAASWIISPLMGGLIAAGFLFLIKHKIIYKKDKLEAAKKIVPLLVMLMAWSFSSYLILKGIKKIVKVEFSVALILGLVIAVVVYFLVRPFILRSAERLSNDKQSINSLFTIPLIVAAALLCFAHGANDVANAVGPLAAIYETISNSVSVTENIASKASIPLWVMIVGASGIALGLLLYGPKLIKTVGSEITELDQMRAFCIAMAAALTVIVATQLGLPVSSTHIALGAIFGIGFLRESIKASYDNMVIEILHHHQDDDLKSNTVVTFLEEFRQATINEKKSILEQLKVKSVKAPLNKQDRKRLKKYYNNELVKRSALYRIAAAWVITVPASGLMAAFLYFSIRGFMLP